MTQATASRRAYLLTWLVLLFLTALTTGAAFLDLGTLNVVVGVGIAGLKAFLIAIFFMHLTRGPHLARVVAAGALIWVGILMLLTFTDYVTRGWLPVPGR